MDTFFKRVSKAQQELKAPKNQYNSFGKYKYRSCEDILEAAKPVCAKYGLVLNISDIIEIVGERYYVKATATLYDTESDLTLKSTACARESETKKGMDDSQITGTASSYARKYALNGLFNIDDTKDADTDEYTKQNAKPVKTYKCDVCGTEFKPVTVNGKTVTPEQQYNLLKQQSTDGVVKCKKCRGE